MSLFGTIQQSSNALKVNELGLQVVGNNIANANTPGYIRQELVQTPAQAIKYGDLTQGLGVRAVGVVQKMDDFVVERMRQTGSQLASSDAINEIYGQLESLFGELTDSDFSSQLNDFSASIQDVLNQPGNEGLRRLVIERAKTLATNINNLSQSFTDITGSLNSQVRSSADEINRLTQQIAKLNVRISEIEGGGLSGSDAVGLRDERLIALEELAQIVNIKSVEQTSGAVTVFVGGDYLVADGIQRPVVAAVGGESGSATPEIRLLDTDAKLEITGGRLHGLYAARDGSVGGTLESLDTFARDLIEQFNRIHTQGQGLNGFSEVLSTYATDDSLGPLDIAGYNVEINNGEFEIRVIDLETGQSKTHSIRVKLTGGTDDTSLDDVRASIDAISGLSSSISPEGELRISADTHLLNFSFQNDTSGFLAAAGINTFFVGDSAATLAVNDTIINDSNMFASSLTGVGGGTDNALALAQAFDVPLDGLSGKSIKQSYEDLVVRTTQDINIQRGVSDGLRNFYRTLEGQHLAASGVNLDEEAVKMLFYQRAYQASSKVIAASNEMLDILMTL